MQKYIFFLGGGVIFNFLKSNQKWLPPLSTKHLETYLKLLYRALIVHKYFRNKEIKSQKVWRNLLRLGFYEKNRMVR